MKYTIDEIVNNDSFKQSVKDVLTEVVLNRAKNPEPAPGTHYKRDWFDRIQSENKLNSDFFIEQIKLIYEKKSNLNAEFRYIINHICSVALSRTTLAEQSN